MAITQCKGGKSNHMEQETLTKIQEEVRVKMFVRLQQNKYPVVVTLWVEILCRTYFLGINVHNSSAQFRLFFSLTMLDFICTVPPQNRKHKYTTVQRQVKPGEDEFAYCE